MRKKAAIITVSIISLLSANQAVADSSGAAFVGGLIGGAIGSAIVNNHKKSYSGTTRSNRSVNRRNQVAKRPVVQSAPSAPWIASPSPTGEMIVTNGQGLTFTYDNAGNPRVIIQPNAYIPPAAYDTTLPVSVAVDGRAFGLLQATVQQGGLVIDDPQLMLLEQQLKPAHQVTVTSSFVTLTVQLSGFTKSIQQLAMFRQQQAIIAAANPEKAKTVATGNAQASSTTIQMQIESVQAQQQPISLKEQGTSVQASADVSVEFKDADQINRRIGDLRLEINILDHVLAEQKQEQVVATDAEVKETLEETIASIELRMKTLEAEYDEKNQKFEVYLTSVKPNDKDLYLTARKSSQVFPKVPYYIPGTSEQGEFWLEPKVTDVGELMFNFRLIDPAAENETTRNLIEVNLDQLENVREALVKLRKNSKTAHENKVRKNYAKRMTCFPELQCPAERLNGEKGKSSTEVIFQIYEDGSTAGRLQLNKGAFQEGVNFSIDSALLLQAYLAHVIKEAKLEFKSGTQTQKDLDQLFE